MAGLLKPSRQLALMISFCCALAAGDEGSPSQQFRVRKLPTQNVSRTPADSDNSIAKYKLNTDLGVLASNGSAFNLGFQFGYALFPFPLYIGPELNFSLYSQGSILGPLLTAWYEIYPTKDRKLCLLAGLVGGPGFTTQIPSLTTTVSMLFLEGTIAEELDDLVSVRGQFRSGFVATQLAVMMNFGVSFRFY